jgi:hypothetical protein
VVAGGHFRRRNSVVLARGWNRDILARRIRAGSRSWLRRNRVVRGRLRRRNRVVRGRLRRRKRVVVR